MATFGSRLKELRKVHLSGKYPKMTQTDLGKKLGVSRAVIVNLEHDLVKPREEFLDLMVYIFHVNKDWLLAGSGSVFDDTDDITLLNKMYRELDPSLQKYIMEHIRKLLQLSKENL